MKNYIIFFLIVCMILLAACSNNETSSSLLDSNTESISDTNTPDNSPESTSGSEAETSEQDSSVNSDSDSEQPNTFGSGSDGGSNSTGNHTPGNTTSSNQTQSKDKSTTSKQPDQPSQPTNISATGISLNKSTVTMEINGTVTLTATVSPVNATDKTVTWSSGNTGVATVDGSGKVTAKAAGTATITAKTSNGKTISCTVTVNASEPAFDINVYVDYARSYGESIGLKYYKGLGSNSWNAPVNLYPGLTDERMKANIRGACDFLKREECEYFELYLEKVKENDYKLYFYYS